MIILLSGKSGVGKDETGKVIQYLTSECSNFNGTKYRTYDDFIKRGGGSELRNFDHHYYSHWQIKKYSDKLKDMTCILIGCTREQLEDHTFKATPLGEEWNRWRLDTVYIPETLNSESFEQYQETSIYSSEKEAIEKGEEIKRYLHIPKEEKRYGMSADFSYEVTMEQTTPRDILQSLGTDYGRRMLHPNIWINALFEDYHSGIKMSDYTESKWIITDSRFPNDVERVKSLGGICIRVNRDSCNGRSNEHESETALDKYDGFNHIIDNNGSIEDLIEKVREILTKENII